MPKQKRELMVDIFYI